MKNFITSTICILLSYVSFSQTYPEWELMKNNYTVNIFEEMITKKGLLYTSKNEAAISVSDATMLTGSFATNGDPTIHVGCATDITFNDYFSVDFHEFLYSAGLLSNWDITGTMFDLSSGNATIKAIIRSNVPIVIQAQLIDVNGHVTANSTIISDTIEVASVNDTCSFSGFVMEDWYSTDWWGKNNERGINAAFPQNAKIPVDISKIASIRFSVKPYGSNSDPITVSLSNVSILSKAPIIQLPAQLSVEPIHVPTDTIYLADMFFDENTDLNDIIWNFSSTDENVDVTYDPILKIIVITNLSKPTIIDITATNELGISSTQQYNVFYVNGISNIEKNIEVIFNPNQNTLQCKGLQEGLLQLYSIQGSLVFESRISETITLPLNKKGAYIYVINNVGKAIEGVIVK